MKRNSSIGLVAVMALLLASSAAGGDRNAPATAGDQLAFGVQMAKRGLWSEALFRFKQAERLRPGDPQVLNNMAVAYEALGNFEQALEYYQQAIKADRTNSDLKRNYSRFIEFYRAFKPDQQQGGEDGEVAEARN
jgi:type IV pilus assembly protein PilF